MTAESFNNMQVMIDSVNKIVYVLAEIPGGELVIFTMNYQKGLIHSENNFYGRRIVSNGPRWSMIKKSGLVLKSIGIDSDNYLLLLLSNTDETLSSLIRLNPIRTRDYEYFAVGNTFREHFVNSGATVFQDFIDMGLEKVREPGVRISALFREHFTNNDLETFQDFIDAGYLTLRDPMTAFVDGRAIHGILRMNNIRPEDRLAVYKYQDLYVRVRGQGIVTVYDEKDNRKMNFRFEFTE